jgi:3-hydroxyacyl-[acyl-carrier-protein] dehydratase
VKLAAIERYFRPDHPAARGHFPEDPVIPGAVLLAEVLRAIESELGLTAMPCEITSAKFLSPARPGDRFLIEFGRSAEGGITFTGSVQGKTVLTGRVKCNVKSTAA